VVWYLAEIETLNTSKSRSFYLVLDGAGGGDPNQLITLVRNYFAVEYTCTAKPNHAIFFSRILRFGVPWKRYFTELVSVGNNETNITGFCMEVFEAAIKTLNYSIVYISFGNGVDAPPSYDNLIQRIEIKKLDVVVVDMTITANNAQLVEFTKPFFDSGLVVVVPLKDQDIISFGWDFMNPFSSELWLLIATDFFISVGLEVYLMEHKNNPRFQGHPDKQFGNVKLLSF
jgi:ionotropic glutamate receptor